MARSLLHQQNNWCRVQTLMYQSKANPNARYTNFNDKFINYTRDALTTLQMDYNT